MATGVTVASSAFFRRPWNPLACSDTVMRPGALLMAKLTWLLLVIGGYGHTLQGPYTPAVGLLDKIPGESAVLAAAFWLGGLCLMVNRVVRVAAVVTGGAVLLLPFDSLAAWHPHAWVGGCVLILVALQGASDSARFLHGLLVLIHGAALLGAIEGANWVKMALASPWNASDYSGSFLRRLAEMFPSVDFAHDLRLASIVVCGAITAGMVIPRTRRVAAWLAVFFYTLLYLVLGAAEVALFAGAVAIAQIAVIDWPRFVIVVWPRSCGWPLWLRVALDRYDFERRTDWPRPPDPDAELEAWFDLRPLAGAKAVANLVLVFPVFYFVLLATLSVIHLALPSFVGVPLNAAIVFALLGFSVVAQAASLKARATKRPPPPVPSPPPEPSPDELVLNSSPVAIPTVVAERGADQPVTASRPQDPPEIIIDIDTPPPADR